MRRQYRVRINGFDHEVCIQRYKTHYGPRLWVDSAKLRVMLDVPEDRTFKGAIDFIVDHKEWIASRLKELRPPIYLKDKSLIPILGLEHRLCFGAQPKGRSHVYQGTLGDKGKIPALFVRGDPQDAPSRVMQWFKKNARSTTVSLVNKHSENLNLDYKKIHMCEVRGQWASCSWRGVLRFNWRLYLAPLYVLDYVAAHEVAHLQVKGHGPDFFEVVEKTMPGYKRAVNWLKKNGHTLFRYQIDDRYCDPSKDILILNVNPKPKTTPFSLFFHRFIYAPSRKPTCDWWERAPEHASTCNFLIRSPTLLPDPPIVDRTILAEHIHAWPTRPSSGPSDFLSL